MAEKLSIIFEEYKKNKYINY